MRSRQIFESYILLYSYITMDAIVSVSVPLHHFAFVFLFDGTFTPDFFHCSLFEGAFLLRLLSLAEQAILEPKFPASSFAIGSRELATSIRLCSSSGELFLRCTHIRVFLQDQARFRPTESASSKGTVLDVSV